jgi:hypothetical protein
MNCFDWGRAKGKRGKGHVRFSSSIPIVVFILISGLEIFGVQLFDLGVGHVVADAGV